MVDELKVRLGSSASASPEYLEATERDEAKLREEYLEGAEHRVKVLLVLGAIADKEQVVVPPRRSSAELEEGPPANQENKRLVEYLDSPRGRAYVHSTLRRSQTVEMLIDRWIAAHPEFANVKHTEDQGDEDEVEAATDALEPEEPTRPTRRSTRRSRTSAWRRRPAADQRSRRGGPV